MYFYIKLLQDNKIVVLANIGRTKAWSYGVFKCHLMILHDFPATFGYPAGAARISIGDSIT